MLISVHRHDGAGEYLADVGFPAARTREGAVAILPDELERIRSEQADHAAASDGNLPDGSVKLLERHQMADQIFAHRQYLTQHGGSLNRHGFKGEGAGARQ